MEKCEVEKEDSREEVHALGWSNTIAMQSKQQQMLGVVSKTPSTLSEQKR